jgi:four helix bundle protein
MRFEQMRVYQAAEQLAAEVDRLLPRARRYAPHAADHLERSADSLLFNIAEGAGIYRPKAKCAAYGVARKEANEVRAVLRRLVIRQVFTESQIRKPYDLAGACIGMLTRAIITLESHPNP